MDLEAAVWENTGCNDLAHDWGKWQAIVRRVMKLQVNFVRAFLT